MSLHLLSTGSVRALFLQGASYMAWCEIDPVQRMTACAVQSEEDFDFAGFVSSLLTAEFATVVKFDVFMVRSSNWRSSTAAHFRSA